MLSQLDYSTHSTFLVLEQLKQKRVVDLAGKDILCIGSHDLLEHDGFVQNGCNNIWAIECNPYVFPDLQERVRNRKNSYAIEACLWSETGLEKSFYFFKDQKYGAGSLFKDEKLSSYVPECKELDAPIKLKTKTFNQLIFEQNIDISNVEWVSLDVQGSELEVLRGASKLFQVKPKVFYTEVSWDNLYSGAPLINEIDMFMEEEGYVRIGLRKDIEAQGDAIYVLQKGK